MLAKIDIYAGVSGKRNGEHWLAAFRAGPAARTFEPRAAEPRTVEAPMLQPSMGLDPDRFSLLKKPLR